MRYQHVIILASVTVFMLAGCGRSNSGSSPPPPASLSSAERIFLADPDGDPKDILDAVMLGADIDNIFGDENAEPVLVEPGDTIGDVLDRAKNS